MGLIILLACVDSPSYYLAFVRSVENGSYSVQGRAIPSLLGASPMEGSLGSVYQGGYLPLWTDTYQKGAPVRVPYALIEGVAVPEDTDGVLLFSFYGHLEDASAWVDEQASRVGLEEPGEILFPMPMAWNPAVSPLIELAPADNAAYATGSNFFLLLPDGDHWDVPLLANAGVVAHEYGHAVFHWLLTGSPLAQPLIADPTTVDGRWQASLHEGFADIQATLFTDDPDFISRSLAQPDRNVATEHPLTSELLPENAEVILGIYDPYPLGTVFATAVWSVRVATGDREATYQGVLKAMKQWEVTKKTMSGKYFLDAWAQASEEEIREEVCASILIHFEEYHTPDVCL